ncbi:triosephosphate isomerase [Candidatus Cytomitobacter indipagum]|uniref:L-erythrulose-1-phosphate isomerase n=1 Tax=Candidatus Cytomitobacter indipagum TaxID=2601575 RepID=A0A5C0UDS2_9PROT|nr:triose-phosphate isomerase [Candidatus Cytomitobacter indipagum]QEK38148.1 triosephosphate isomerase [Candidatus Cytomitobacter indipagum]
MSFFVIANWKGIQNASVMENIYEYNHKKNVKYIVAPNYFAISKLSNLKNISLCAQNFTQNTLTGSISIELLKQFNVKHCLCNHADHYQSNYNPKSMIKACDENDIIPIIFVRDIYEAEKLSNLSKSGIIVYEPHEYIGKKDAPGANIIADKVMQIRKITNKPICYGGSLNESNYQQFIGFLDGLCFGRLSREKIFNQIIQNINQDIEKTIEV